MGDKQRKLLGFDSFKGFGPLNIKDGPEDRSVTRNEEVLIQVTSGTNSFNY